MKRNVIQAIALIGAISAGGIAHADNGFQTGHHTFVASSAGTSSGVMTKGSVGHNGAFIDGKVHPDRADDHSQSVTRGGMTTSLDMQSNGPLPPEAGNER